MKIKYIYLSAVAVAVLFLTVTAFRSNHSEDEPKKTNKEIIKFSHSKHADLAQCTDCHTNVSEATDFSKRMLPNMKTCGSCHDITDQKACYTCHYEGGRGKLEHSTPQVYFNHKAHLAGGKTCVDCHKGMDKVDYAFQSATSKPAMETCYECHNNTGKASIQCEACHINTANLKPEDHKLVNFMSKHGSMTDKKDAKCQMCHDNDFCEACHTATTGIDAGNNTKSFFAPYTTYKLNDGSKMQKITRAHDLNYRFTHGIDAKLKMTECRTCHQPESFCGSCHEQKGGDFAFGGSLPLSHTAKGFVTIGVGTGGGEHAKLAKRDIESCESCHDAQGADPVCVMCHTDNDGIKGTNPKTHKTGFMKNSDHGDWHNDRNSICYTCHTDANANPKGIAGQGFCGYCHGAKR